LEYQYLNSYNIIDYLAVLLSIYFALSKEGINNIVQ